MVKAICLQQAVNAATLAAVEQHDQYRADALVGLLDTTTGLIGWINRYVRLADRVSDTESSTSVSTIMSQTAVLFDAARNAAAAAGIQSEAITSTPN